jgi:hypothetical protein
VPRAARAAATTVSIGISSWSSTTVAPRTDPTSASSGTSAALAPGTTTIRFSPLPSSTGIVAEPVGTPGVRSTRLTSTPDAASAASCRSPAGSCPTRPTMCTPGPSSAAAAAWLAPLPPGASTAERPITVSPRPGNRSTATSTSSLRLPTTVTDTRNLRVRAAVGSGDHGPVTTSPPPTVVAAP